MLQGVPKSLYTLLIIINNVFIIFYLNLIEIVKKMWKNWRAVSIVLSLPFLNFMSVLVEILLTGQSSGVAHIIKQFPRSLLTFTFSNPPPQVVWWTWRVWYNIFLFLSSHVAAALEVRGSHQGQILHRFVRFKLFMFLELKPILQIVH